jgi:hypothetical protein
MKGWSNEGAESKIVVASVLPKKISLCFRATSKREIWVHVHVQVSLLANAFYHVLYICDVQFPSFELCIPLLDLLTETAKMAKFIPFHSYHLFLQFSQSPPNHQGTGEQQAKPLNMFYHCNCCKALTIMIRLESYFDDNNHPLA